MKDFPNYLLQKKETNNSIVDIKSSDNQIRKDTSSKKSFQPSNVPSILKGLTRENRLDYTDIKSALRLKIDDILLFEISDQQTNDTIGSKYTESHIKKSGLHRTFQQLITENEHNHFILTKGDAHER